jgi:hypothetical protein
MWNQGDILVHEIGHTYGLLHPYQGDCSGSEQNSDRISDTPRQTGNPFGTCQSLRGRNSCSRSAGLDDLQNYMVATADSCRSHFTPGQVSYIQSSVARLKPTLMKQLPPDCVAAIDSTDSSPDLQPCLPGTLENVQGRKTCRTDKDNASVWAWACCPTSMSWTNDACRQGTPNFNSARAVSRPRGRRLRVGKEDEEEEPEMELVQPPVEGDA